MLEMNLLKQVLPTAEFLNGESLVASLRMIKDQTEINYMKKAVDIAQKALLTVLPQIKIGITEKEIAAQLTIELLRNGSNPRLPFSPIVSVGPNSANPHAFPSNRKLSEGDLLVIDWGANIEGYFSDITRTFSVGQVEEEYRQIAKIVLEANQAGSAMAGPGISAREVDKAARDVIEQAGYGKYFIHRTGHGLGMEGHEEPYIRGDNPEILENGMTFTIEPGIYLPNRGGVRIEDDVLINEEGCLSLTDLPRDLITVG
jgi:Xaa-Pro dipeptidase